MTELFQTQDMLSEPPLIERERRKLERMEAEIKAAEKAAEEEGRDYELEWSDDYHEAKRALKIQTERVARMEDKARIIYRNNL